MLFRKAEAGSGMNRPFCSRNVLVLLAAAAVMVFFLASSRRERVNNELTPSYLPKQDADVLRTSSVASSSGSKAQLPKILPPLRKRDDLGYILNDEGFKTGVELGVQKGLYAKKLLEKWKTCERYVMVDVWAPLDNYKDEANVNQDSQDRLYEETMANTERWSKIREVCRNFTEVCAKKYKNEQFDFIYVDARHDYKGVLVDLQDWWPLLKEGGIMAGHDFVTNEQGPKQTGQDWSVSKFYFDGTVDPTGRAVYGAVVDFFNNKSKPDQYRQITATYRESGCAWHTWMVRK